MYREVLNTQHSEIEHIMKTLEITTRHVRSLDFLGSALKFVAGTPDHQDYSALLNKQNMLIENNNLQTKINSALQNKINEITIQLNAIKKGFNDNNEIAVTEKIPIFEFLANRNNLIIKCLNNLVFSIVLVENELINPLILDEIDIDRIFDFENLPISISNLLLASKVKVLQNDHVIHYILKIPKVSKYCKNIYPVC